MFDLTRGFPVLNWILRGFLSLGVSLPWLAHSLPPTGADFLFDAFPTLIFLVGTSHLTVWVHHITARREANHEIMTVVGVSPGQTVLAQAAAGLTFVAFTGTTTLLGLHFLAPFARLSPIDATIAGRALSAGLGLNLTCCLWVVTITPPSPQRMPTLLFSLLAVWLGLPIAAELGRDLNLIPFQTSRLLELYSSLTAILPGAAPIPLLADPLLIVTLSLLLVIGIRSHWRQTAPRPRAPNPRIQQLLLRPLDDAPAEDQAYFRRLASRVPDAIGYLHQAAWVLALAALCLVPPGSPWLWIALSTIVVGQLFYGAWLWHFSSSILDEDRQLGDSMTHADRARAAQGPLQRWLQQLSRWSRWTSAAFYLVLTPLAGLGDDAFPWILFLALTAVLPLMSPGLTAAARDLTDRTSRGVRDFLGVLVLVGWPLFLAIALGRFAGQKGFLAGIAVDLLLSLAGVVGLRAVANSPWWLFARIGLQHGVDQTRMAWTGR